MIDYAATTRAGQRIAKYFGKDYAHVRLEVSEIIEEELLKGQGKAPVVRWFNSSQRALNLNGGTKPRGSVVSGTKATGSPGFTLTDVAVIVTVIVVAALTITILAARIYIVWHFIQKYW